MIPGLRILLFLCTVPCAGRGEREQRHCARILTLKRERGGGLSVKRKTNRAGGFLQDSPGTGGEYLGISSPGAGKTKPDGASAGFEASVVQWVNTLIDTGVRHDASDIHLEPCADKLQVRHRIDGALRDLPPCSKDVMAQVISRVKLLAGMDIAERRLPQDGSIHVEVAEKTIHIRVSSLPTVHGEKLVLRVLNPEKVVRPLEALGFSPLNLERYYRFLDNPYGMVLVTGPTGCGKTTTLYSTLQYLNSPEKNILTVENPVEYRLERINQVQVNSRIGLTFAATLRSALRQDPDIIMVGEIRDTETAEIVTRAALTGHLVFSTLHTNDAVRSITRLLDMGVKPYLLTASLVGIVSQRLVRLICLHCRDSYEPSPTDLAMIEASYPGKEVTRLYQGKGCAACSGTGFKGRTAIHEIMPVDEEMRQMIRSSSNTDTIRNCAVAKGMIPFIQDGIRRSKEGVTTLDEVMRVAYSAF